MALVTCHGGLVDFELVAGRPSLDFAGTLQRRDEEAIEMLSSPSDLGAWAVSAGLMDTAPRVSKEQLASAIKVREAIFRVAVATVEGVAPPVGDVRRLNSLCKQPMLQVTLGSDGWAHHTGTIEQLLASLARDAVEVLGGDEASLLRRCEGEGCSWIYLDRSRGRSRRWCGMAICGNRVKAAAYRKRRREANA